MEKFVFILGAGFSAPFGIPTTKHFLDRAKDIYEKYPKFAHFREIIDIIQQYYVTRKWYKIDLDNIEDLLSMLEMKRNIDYTDDNSKFKKFIIDVVNAYSQKFVEVKKGEVSYNPSTRWDQNLFEYENDSRNNILAMLSAAFNIKYFLNSEPVKNFKGVTSHYNVGSHIDEKKTLYSNFISLNYDMILENALIHLNSFTGLNLKFKTEYETEIDYDRNVYLAKLHGSINKDIIPPTWNKYLDKNIRVAWSLAYKLLSEANRIIIIGYSLPETDTYVRYLLGLSAVNSFNLKNIDIICYDNNDEVLQRYNKFMNFNDGKVKFYDTKTEYYLSNIYDRRFYFSNQSGDYQEIHFSIGNAHLDFIRSMNIKYT